MRAIQDGYACSLARQLRQCTIRVCDCSVVAPCEGQYALDPRRNAVGIEDADRAGNNLALPV